MFEREKLQTGYTNSDNRINLNKQPLKRAPFNQSCTCYVHPIEPSQLKHQLLTLPAHHSLPLLLLAWAYYASIISGTGAPKHPLPISTMPP